MFIEDVTKQIAKMKVIAFDLFDTLILRPFMRPKDLFGYLGACNNEPNFLHERVSAERIVRNKKQCEVTIDEIYEIMPKYLNYMKNKELNAELTLCYPNNEVLTLFNSALVNEKIVIVISDMYLPYSTICAILDNVGIKGYSKLYLSSDKKATKAQGALYKIMINDLKISPSEILMIGDNYHSDYQVPKQMGIQVCHYISPIENYFKKHTTERRLFKKNQTWGMSVILALDMAVTDNNDYWEKIGYRIGGPISSSYCIFISRTVSNADVIFFISRDGWSTREVYNKLITHHLPSEYVYVSRMISMSCGYGDSEERGYARFLFDRWKDEPEIASLGIKSDASDSECIKAMNQHKKLFEKLESQCRERYHVYLKRIAESYNHIAIVDATTMKYSSQKLISGVIGDNHEVVGCYYTEMAESKLKHYSYRNCAHNIYNWTDVNVSEFFLSSPDRPACGVDENGNIQFSKLPNESSRKKIFTSVVKGEVNYAKTMKMIFGDNLPPIPSKDVTLWVRTISKHEVSVNNPMADMEWAQDVEHKEMHSLVFVPRETPYQILSHISYIMWRIKSKK